VEVDLSAKSKGIPPHDLALTHEEVVEVAVEQPIDAMHQVGFDKVIIAYVNRARHAAVSVDVVLEVAALVLVADQEVEDVLAVNVSGESIGAQHAWFIDDHGADESRVDVHDL